MVTVATDLFDGEFVHVRACDLRVNDVILGGARSVITAPITASGGIAVDTVTGPEIFDADAAVYVFRPADGCPEEECLGCTPPLVSHAT